MQVSSLVVQLLLSNVSSLLKGCDMCTVIRVKDTLPGGENTMVASCPACIQASAVAGEQLPAMAMIAKNKYPIQR
jgi:hypothetical protein